MSTETENHVDLPGAQAPGGAAGSGAPVRGPGGDVFDDGTPTPEELRVVDWVLTTTRANRKTLDMDREVPLEVVEECLQIAMQAPTSHNDQRWHWLVITDREKIAGIAEVYKLVWEQMSRGERRKIRRFKGANQEYDKVQDSADWLPQHLHEVPLMVIPCLVGPRYDSKMMRHEWDRFFTRSGNALGIKEEDATPLWLDTSYFASIYPAVWSFQLALRSRGLGSVLTVFHLAAEQRVAELLGLPSSVVQTCLLPVAYTTKRTFKPAKRAAMETRISWNTWGTQRDE